MRVAGSLCAALVNVNEAGTEIPDTKGLGEVRLRKKILNATWIVQFQNPSLAIA